jgi:hypothetical protein
MTWTFRYCATGHSDVPDGFFSPGESARKRKGSCPLRTGAISLAIHCRGGFATSGTAGSIAYTSTLLPLLG